MNKSLFLTEILEKIGSPLVGAVQLSLQDQKNGQIDASIITAKLLERVTKLSTELYNHLGIQDGIDKDDTARIAVAGVITPLVADHYKARQDSPSDEDLAKLLQMIQNVLTFGDNFSPAADQQSRLQTIRGDAVLFDKNQVMLVMVQALVPVISAVGEFSFGQNPRKLIQDIVTKIMHLAQDLSVAQGYETKLEELIIFKSLAALYTDCHRQVTAQAATGGQASIEAVWESFEIKYSMVETLLGFVPAQSEGKSSGAKGGGSSRKPDPAIISPMLPNETPVDQTPASGPMGFFKKNPEPVAPSAEPLSSATLSSVPPVTGETPATTGNPMSFFKSKKTDS